MIVKACQYLGAVLAAIAVVLMSATLIELGAWEVAAAIFAVLCAAVFTIGIVAERR